MKRKLKTIFAFLMLFGLINNAILIQSCKQKEIKRESVLDSISHVEDSIYFQIDSLPMLCDELDMKGQMIDIGDCKLYCEVKGKGMPLVLINGGPGGTHHCFHPWFKRAEKFMQVIYYDQRGCGQSDYIPGDGYNFRQAIDDLDKLRIKLGIEKWAVCGYSYGGALAQYYTATYPEHVAGLVLMSASTLLHNDAIYLSRQHQFISEDEERRIDEIYELYSEGKINSFQLMYNKEINGDWKRQNFYKPTKEEAIRLALYEWEHDTNFNSTMGSSYSRYDFQHVFDNNPIPTLICEGKWDLTWSAEKASIFKANHPNAQFVLFEQSGHNTYREEPDLFFSTLKNFIQSLKPVQNEKIDTWKTHVKKIISPQEELFEREAQFFTFLKKEGADEAYKLYRSFRENNVDKQMFSENGMNMSGYEYLYKNDYEQAVILFQMNVEAYPESSNVYDSLGEAYLQAGNKKRAKEYYEKSLDLNPNNENAKKILSNL
ncbi:MAG: alpha/beta fold hydrolase [Prevotellaceae bacterium]|jgi:proline iminopeptidase|nr:alpha/beta fold hydrolase [Prevotellaceae bacterium]